MILHLTHGSTHLSVDIQGENGLEPQVSLIQGQPASAPSPMARVRRGLPGPLAFLAVGLLCGTVGYRVAPGRTDRTSPLPALAQASGPPSTTLASDDGGQVPTQIQRELATRLVVTPTTPAATAAQGGRANPFGLD